VTFVLSLLTTEQNIYSHLRINAESSGLGNISAVLLLPFLVYSLNLGLNGAALATIASQYVLHLNIFKQFHPDVPQFQEHTNCFIV
jgi:hypothetical protein